MSSPGVRIRRQPAPPVTLSEIARRLGGRLELAPGVKSSAVVEGLATLPEAGLTHLSFVANRRYVRQLRATLAMVVLLDEVTPSFGRTAIRLSDPYRAFALALEWFYPTPETTPGIHPTAVVDPTARVDGAWIDALAVVGPEAVVGEGTVLEPGVVVGPRAVVGAGCRLMARSVVGEACVLGDRVTLNPGAVVGGDGFGFAPGADGHLKIPQLGNVVIEDDVEIGANSCVDRAALGETRICQGAKLDNLVQVGHGAIVGPHALMVAFSGVAGSSRLGRLVTLAARAAVLGHIELGDGVSVGAGSMVTSSVPPGAHVSGSPAFTHSAWRRAAMLFKRLPEMDRALRRLEAAVGTGDSGDRPSGETFSGAEGS